MQSALILALSAFTLAVPQSLQQCGPDYGDCPSGYDCEFPNHTTCSPGLDCPAYCYPASSKRDSPQQGAVCSTANSAPCPSGTSCLTPDGYVCGPGDGCYGVCQAPHAPQVCGEGEAGYNCPSGQLCLVYDGSYCGPGQDCFGYCTPVQ